MTRALFSLQSPWYQQLQPLLRNQYWMRRLAMLLGIIAVVLSVYICWMIAEAVHTRVYGLHLERILTLIVADLSIFLVLGVILSRRFIRMWVARKHGGGGSRLQTRIVVMFSLVVAIPTIVMALFSTVFFNIGIQGWFDKRIQTAFAESVAVAEAYFREHQEVLRGDILAMAHDIGRQAYIVRYNTHQLEEVIQRQVSLRGLTEAIVFERGHVLAQTNLSFSAFVRHLAPEVFEQADQGKVAIIALKNGDTVRALVRLEPFSDTYLMVGKFADPKVLAHMEHTQEAAQEYQQLANHISRLQIQFSFVFVAVSLLLLLSAIGVGVRFAGSIARPISYLVKAMHHIKAGNLGVRVEERPENDEIGILQRGFNGMTQQLSAQRAELLRANREIDRKRIFNEMVLADVSAGIMVLDKKCRVTLLNRSAQLILGLDKIGLPAPLMAIFPQLLPLIAVMQETKASHMQEEMHVTVDKSRKTLLVRLASDTSDANRTTLITFDDISELIIAQRTAVWSDVARRIAHEIKNPLTPIQLAADRIAKRFATEVSDQEMLQRYTGTILRHVQDISRIVEEFVNFARLPLPKLLKQDITVLLRDIALSRASVMTQIEYSIDISKEPIMVALDAGQISQTFTNLLKNAEESLENSVANATQKRILGKIKLSVATEGDFCIIKLQDSGRGFPVALLDRLTEPYITTGGGMGLGLAIVRKIVEDHGGSMDLHNVPEGGACVEIHLPLGK